MSPHGNVIIGNSFEEIVFSNRNKEYGAYALRKKQKMYLIFAFFISFFTVSSTVITPLIYNYYKRNSPSFNGIGTIIFTPDSAIQVEPPIVPELKLDMAKTERYVPPVVVDTVMEEITLISMDDALLLNVNIDPPTNIEQVVEQDDVIEVEDRPFINVDVPAEFDGGDINNFNKWVSQNIKYPSLAIENGITGKVYVQFVVNSKGKVENITILRGADPALDQEAVRVIASSPKWSAPLQGGKPVKQLFSLPVIFRLE